MQAESNRDRKQRSKPFELADFCFFADRTEAALPPAAAGAALLALLQRDLMPGWAIGPWCEALEQVGAGHEPPARLCWAADDVIILAPWRADSNHWRGFLIVDRKAIGQPRTLWSEEGESVDLMIPAALATTGAFMFAREGVTLPIIR
jgi:hypothetical protein